MQQIETKGAGPKIFFILTSVTSETSWGQTMSFSNLSFHFAVFYQILLLKQTAVLTPIRSYLIKLVSSG